MARLPAAARTTRGRKHVCVRELLCVSARECVRERASESEREICVCEKMGVRERECVCVREREGECERGIVSERERYRKMSGEGGQAAPRGKVRRRFCPRVVRHPRLLRAPVWQGVEGLSDFDLQVKAKIWPGLSYMCHLRSTSVLLHWGRLDSKGRFH